MENQFKPNLIIIGVFLGAKEAETLTSKSGQQYTIRKFGVKQAGMNDYGEPWEKIYPFQLFGDKSTQLDDIQKGDLVVVRFNINPGMNAEGKPEYLNVNAWKVEIHPNNRRTSGQSTPQPVEANTVPQVKQGEATQLYDDIPFWREQLGGVYYSKPPIKNGRDEDPNRKQEAIQVILGEMKQHKEFFS